MVEEYLSIFIKAVFIENIAINFFLGMCTFLAISKRIQPAIGLGVAVIVVLGLAVPINNLIFNFFLKVTFEVAYVGAIFGSRLTCNQIVMQ